MSKVTKMISSLAGSILLVCSGTLFANEIASPCNIQYKTLDSLKCDGSANLSGVTIHGNVNVKGSVNITNATIDGTINAGGNVTISRSTIKGMGKSEVHGDLNIDSTDISGPIVIDGKLNVIRSTLKDLVTVKNSEINIYESTLQSKLVINSKNLSIITVGENSEVEGGIIFKDAAGKVILKDSRSSVGSVANGKVSDNF